MKFYKQPWIGLAFSVFAVGNVYADTVIASKDYVDTAVGAKQDKLGGSTDAGKVVVATGTAGTVSYKAIDTTPTTDSTNLITSGAVKSAIAGIDVSGAVSDGANALNLTSSATKAPSVKAVQGSVLYVGNTASANTKSANKAISSVTGNASVFSTNSTIKADSDAYVPSVAAVEARVKGAIEGLDVGQVSSTGKPIMTIKQDDGKITATTGQITNAGISDTAAITTNKMGAISGYTKATTNAALAATDTLNTALGKLEKKADDASDVATSVQTHIANQGTYTVDWNDSTVTTSNDAGKASNLGAAKASQDTYIPTISAVEARVQATESNFASNLNAKEDKSNKVTSISSSSTDTQYPSAKAVYTATKDQLKTSDKDSSNVVTSTSTTKVPTVAGVQAGIVKQGTATADWSTVTSSTEGASAQLKAMATAANRDSYIPTVAAVEKRLDGLKVTSAMITDGTIAAADIGTGAVTTDKLGAGAVTSAKIKDGDVKTDDIADKNVTTGKLADSAVTTVKLAADAVTNAKLADNAVQTENVADKSLKYQNDMNNTALYDINTGAVPASDVCTKTAPCMLTYYKEGGNVYTRWTPLDADGLSANAATTDVGASI